MYVRSQWKQQHGFGEGGGTWASFSCSSQALSALLQQQFRQSRIQWTQQYTQEKQMMTMIAMATLVSFLQRVAYV